MNKNKLTAMCHKISKQTGLGFNTVLLQFFLEDVLKKLASSKYKESFIFKGGFVLANIVGLDTRSTIDIDIHVRQIRLEKSKILMLLEEVLNDSINEISYDIKNITEIMPDDMYGGFRAHLLARFDNIRQPLHLDFATGDIITPHPIEYTYDSIFDDQKVKIFSYPVETMIAEKFHAIYARKFLSSRVKDYYDLYIIYELRKSQINFSILGEACNKTFGHRDKVFNPDQVRAFLLDAKKDTDLFDYWEAYKAKHTFVGQQTFADIIDSIIKLLDKM